MKKHKVQYCRQQNLSCFSGFNTFQSIAQFLSGIDNPLKVEMPRITHYNNQYFKLKEVVFVNRRRIADFFEKFKILEDN